MNASALARRPMIARRTATWAAGPADPRLTDSAVHVWRADLATVESRLGELLSREERKRAERISRASQREKWQRSRGLLRALLARYLRAEPQALRIAAGSHGKPELASAGLADAALWFNLSHSRELALYAIAADGPVGVDVQHAREPGARGVRDHVALAARLFGAEQARRLALLEEPNREAEFLRLWTRYEAECKRRGTGIMSGSAVAGEPSWLAELDVGPRSAAAVACSLEPGELRCWDWSE